MKSAHGFSVATKQLALVRQKFCCASCGARIASLVAEGKQQHEFGEIVHAHHILHIKFGGMNSLENCVILCWSCHYSAHEGGKYHQGTVVGCPEDFPHFNGQYLVLGLPARNTRNEKPRPFSNGSTVAVTSSTG
jgi:hypothetical protein